MRRNIRQNQNTSLTSTHLTIDLLHFEISERYHAISTPASTACFTMLGRGPFSRAFCHATPTIWNLLPADLSEDGDFNNMFYLVLNAD